MDPCGQITGYLPVFRDVRIMRRSVYDGPNGCAFTVICGRSDGRESGSIQPGYSKTQAWGAPLRREFLATPVIEE